MTNPVRTARRSGSLGLRECATRVGVSHARISEYETGEHEPSVSRLQAIARASGLRFVPVPVPASTLSAAEAADEVYELVRASAPLRKTVRVVFQLNDDLSAAPTHVLGALVAAPPPETGDSRLDAFIAGLVEWHTSLRGLPTPPWVSDAERTLEDVWQVDSNTDPCEVVEVIARHGVLVGHAELESV